jgi:hypothetical protein
VNSLQTPLAQPELVEIAFARQPVPEQVQQRAQQPSKAAGSIPTSSLAMTR